MFSRPNRKSDNQNYKIRIASILELKMFLQELLLTILVLYHYNGGRSIQHDEHQRMMFSGSSVILTTLRPANAT